MVGKLGIPNIFVFEWDQENLEHIKKHNVTYNECEDVFFNNPVYFRDEKHSNREERLLVYGITNENRLITVVFTIRKDKVRVISARDQHKKEKEIYKASNKF